MTCFSSVVFAYAAPPPTSQGRRPRQQLSASRPSQRACARRSPSPAQVHVLTSRLPFYQSHDTTCSYTARYIACLEAPRTPPCLASRQAAEKSTTYLGSCINQHKKKTHCAIFCTNPHKKEHRPNTSVLVVLVRRTVSRCVIAARPRENRTRGLIQIAANID